MQRFRTPAILIHWSANGGVKTPSACGIVHWRRAVLGDTFQMYSHITCKKCRIMAEINRKEKQKK